VEIEVEVWQALAHQGQQPPIAPPAAPAALDEIQGASGLSEDSVNGPPPASLDTSDGHGGHSVLLNRTVRFLGTPPNSVPEELGTDRFLRRPGTEVFGISSGIYRKYRTTNKGRLQSANNNKNGWG
jgi:hypothetical protein